MPNSVSPCNCGMDSSNVHIRLSLSSCSLHDALRTHPTQFGIYFKMLAYQFKRAHSEQAVIAHVCYSTHFSNQVGYPSSTLDLVFSGNPVRG